VNISFDVPSIDGAASHEVSIALFDMRGNVVAQLAKGAYAAGHYTVRWNVQTTRSGSAPGTYIVRMKAMGFDKRVKIIKVE
jgi:hypothetical protein